MLVLRSQFFDFLRETIYKHALEHLEAAGPEKKWAVFFLPTVNAYQYLTFLKVCDWSGHIFGASTSPRPFTKKWLCHPLPLFVAVSMIPNMWHSSWQCMRHSWLTNPGFSCLDQLVCNNEARERSERFFPSFSKEKKASS